MMEAIVYLVFDLRNTWWPDHGERFYTNDIDEFMKIGIDLRRPSENLWLIPVWQVSPVYSLELD